MAKASIPIASLNPHELPPVCLMTGSEENVTFHRRDLQWTPPWVFLLLLIPGAGVLMAIGASAIAQRRVEAELPFSAQALSKMRRLAALRAGSVLFLIVGFVGSGLLILTDEPLLKTLGPVLMVVAILSPLAAYFATRKWRVVAHHISKTHLVLQFRSPEAAAQIREHLKAAERDPLDAQEDAVA